MKVSKTFRLSNEAIAVLNQQSNQSQYIEDLILNKPAKKALGEFMTRPEVEALIEEYLSGSFSENPTGGASSNSSVPSPTEKKEPEIPACCLNDKKQCSHWIWDGLNSKYTNKYSGEVKEIYY